MHHYFSLTLGLTSQSYHWQPSRLRGKEVFVESMRTTHTMVGGVVKEQGSCSVDVALLSRGIYQRLWRFVQRRLRSKEETADVVHDAYIRLIATSKCTNIHNPPAFLHTTALNLIRDRERAAIVRGTTTAAAEEISCHSPSPEQTLSDREQIKVLESALLELGIKQRAALILYRFDGLKYGEIAQKLGISISMTEKHIRRALDHCRKRLVEANGGT